MKSTSSNKLQWLDKNKRTQLHQDKRVPGEQSQWWAYGNIPPLTHLPLNKMAAISIFRYIFVNEKFCILIEIPLNFVPKGPINNNQASV